MVVAGTVRVVAGVVVGEVSVTVLQPLAGSQLVVAGTVRVVAGVVVGEVSVTVLQPLAGSQLVVFVSTLTISAGLGAVVGPDTLVLAGAVVPAAFSDSEGQYSFSSSQLSVAVGAVAPVVLVSAAFGSK